MTVLRRFLALLSLALVPSIASAQPAGADKQVQYNASGAFGASSNLTFDYSTNFLKIANGAFEVQGTQPVTGEFAGIFFDFVTTGSGAGGVYAMYGGLEPGYTGSSETVGIHVENAAAGTCHNLNLGGGTSPCANRSLAGETRSITTTGYNIGVTGSADGSSSSAGLNVGGVFKASSSTTAPNYGLIASGRGSTASNAFRNVGLFAMLGNTLPSVGTTTSSAIVAEGATFPLLMGFRSNVEMLRFDQYGRLEHKGTAPTVSSCGTTPTVGTNSTDMAGTVTVGTGTVTSCTVTFANAWDAAPFCTLTDNTTYQSIRGSTTTSALTVTAQTGFQGDVFSYHCMQ